MLQTLMNLSGRSPTIQAACSHTAIIQPAAVMKNYIPYKNSLSLLSLQTIFKTQTATRSQTKADTSKQISTKKQRTWVVCTVCLRGK